SQVSLSPYDITSSVTDYSYSFTTTNITPSVNTGINTSPANPKDTLVCAPFVAGFHWQNPCAGQTVQFNDSSYYYPTSWKWNFGDGSYSISQNPTHIYSTAGTYTVDLVSSNGSITDSIKHVITIYPLPSQLKTSTTKFCLGDSVNLKATGTGGKTFAWNPASLVSDSTDSTTWAYPYQNSVFVASATNIFGCAVYDSFIVKIDTSTCTKPATIGGVINSYAAVKVIDTCNNFLAVDDPKPFKVGEKVLLIQMKGALIDTSNQSTFGSISKINSAGAYEYVVIDSIGGSNLYLKYKTTRNYDAGAGLQLVTVPQYTNAYIKAPLKATGWNGSKGGVLIFEASGSVIMNSNIDASGKGFSGGAKSSGSATCAASDYFYKSTSGSGGNKGEGIVVTHTGWAHGRGPAANGGGGGNGMNTGGGGGGNYDAGGIGGNQILTCSSKGNYSGLGGLALSSYINSGRLFLGGGGGEGHEYSNNGLPGDTGGGIIMIKAKTLYGGGNFIKSNGLDQATIPTSFGEGAGGGGAGGSIYLDVQSYRTKLNTQANGGKGGNVDDYECDGPGGGGGGGALVITKSSIPSVIGFSAVGGKPGINITTYNFNGCSLSSDGADDGKAGGAVAAAYSIPQGTTPYGRPHAKITTKTQTICTGDSILLTTSSNGIK